VYFDNYQGDLKFPTVFIATDIVEINRQLALYSRTGDVLALFPSLYTSSNNQFYHSGDLITVLYDTNVTGYMTIPAPLAGDLCQDSNPVTYLNDMSTTCYRYLSSDGSECSRSSLFNAQNYYANFTLSNVPQISSNSSVPIKLGNVNCFDVSGRLVSCDSTSLLPVYNTSLLVCNNALLQISYKFYHNGSAGIIMAFVDIDIGQVDSHRIKQVFSVQFLSLESNTTINTFKRSGNPGYIDGEPVIVGNYDVNNIHGVIADWLTIMNVGKNGNCNERYSVTFKDNIKTFCTLRIQSSVIKSGCYDLDTLSLFFGNFQFNRVAIYGNSDPSNASQWVDVFTDKPVTMGCSSVVTGVQILVFYSYSGSVHSPHTLITGVHMQYITQNISDKVK
jgi:tectonic-1/3